MRFILVLIVLLAGVAMAAEPLPSPDAPGFARAVLERVDDMYRGEQAHGVMEMEVKTRHWTRAMTLESWSKGKDYSLVRILEPKKDRGTATLKDRSDLFTYLSNTGRTVKIAGAMMGGSWMGSHFTNDDLVRATRLSDDYEIRTLPPEKRDGAPVYHFKLLPRPGRPIVWGRVEVVVRASDLQPLEETYYDEDGKAVRTLQMQEWRPIAGRVRPTVMLMRPLDGSDEYTRVTWKSLDMSVHLDPGFFSVRTLTSR